MTPPAVTELLTREGLRVLAVFRHGPRYWVGRVERGAGEQLILKMVLDDTPWRGVHSGRTFRPSDQLRAELQALQGLGAHRQRLAGDVPMVAAGSPSPPVWLLRADVPGESMAATASSLFFRPEFYQLVSPEAMADYLASYHQLTPQVLAVLEVTPRTAESSLAAKLQLDEPWLSPPLRRYLEARVSLHDAHRDTLVHGEVYPPHLFWHQGRLMLIDWENAGLGTPVTDATAIWMRAFDQPAWQAAFYRAVADRSRLARSEFQELWRVSLAYQSAQNLHYLTGSELETPAEKARIAPHLRRILDEVI